MNKKYTMVDGVEMEIAWRCCVCKTPVPQEGQVPSDGFHRQCFIDFHQAFMSKEDLEETLAEIDWHHG